MLDDTTSFNPDTAQAPGDLTPDVTTSGLTSLNLSELRATISNAHSALETELADTAAVSLSESDSALLRIGQPDVNYAFTDTLERAGIDHIDVDSAVLSSARTTLDGVYTTGDNVLAESGHPSPDVEFYHRAAAQAQASGQEIQDVVSEMRDAQPLMMREDLGTAQTVQALPDGDVVLAQSKTGPMNAAIDPMVGNTNTSRVQTPAEGVFQGGTNYCTRSAPDINLENHSPSGKLVDATEETISIYPRAGSVPSVTIPNTVDADGFSTRNLNDHVYNVYTDTRGLGLSPEAVGQAFRDNPTPGDDNTATADGTRNDVEEIPREPLSTTKFEGRNWVNSFSVPSPDSKRFTDISVNYTRDGEHLLHEGYVIRYGVVEGGEVVGLRSYGEGHAWEQSELLSGAWCKPGQEVWNANHQEIIEDASAGVD